LIIALQELHDIFSLRISESVLPKQEQYSFVEILVREFSQDREELMASLGDAVLLLMGDCSRNQ
jgi:presenilin-like A22 family membrane protease